MKTILGLIVYSLAWFGLLVGILVLGFQSVSLGDVFTLSGTFGHFDSKYEIFFTFVVPLIFVVVLGGLAMGTNAKYKEAE